MPKGAGRPKKTAAVSIPLPGSFAAVSLNTATDEVVGAAGVANPEVDLVNTERGWLHMPVAATTYEPGYSLTASVGSNNPPPDIYAALLPGTTFEVKSQSVSAQGDGAAFSHFDDCDVLFDNVWHHYTDADRNITLTANGAKLTINADVDGLTCLTLVLPGGETYMVAGIRF